LKNDYGYERLKMIKRSTSFWYH